MELTWKKRERKGAQVEQHQCSFAGVRAKRKDAGVRRLLTLTVTWPLCLAVKSWQRDGWEHCLLRQGSPTPGLRPGTGLWGHLYRYTSKPSVSLKRCNLEEVLE